MEEDDLEQVYVAEELNDVREPPKDASREIGAVQDTIAQLGVLLL